MQRRHDIDALRVLAFGLLILYHLGMVYAAPVEDWGYHLKSIYLAPWLKFPMLASNFWRMDLLFLISGLAMHFLRKRQPLGRLAWKRTGRLLWPLAFGMLVVVPIQPYVQGVANGLVEPGFVHFMMKYLSGGPWPAGAFDGWQYGFTWNHLWYLAYLWNYTLLLLVMLPALESGPGQRALAWLRRMRGWRLMLLPALLMLALNLLLASRYPMTHALLGDWYAHASYFTMFLIGYVIGTDEGLWTELARLRKVSLVTAVASFAAFYVIDQAGNWVDLSWVSQATYDTARMTVRTCHFLYQWSVLLAVLGWGHVLLNKPFRWLPYAREAVFPWYILHQSVMLALAAWLLPKHVGPVLEPALLLLGTVAGCAVLHEFAIRRVRWLRPAFGLDPKPAPPRPEAAALAGA